MRAGAGVAAALSVQDPRERPAEQLAQADQKHALFRGREREAAQLMEWIDRLEVNRASTAQACR